MKLVILFLIFSFLSQDKEVTLVHYKGALRNAMRDGDISAKTSLKEFEGKKNFYALGAIEKLKGEIQIFNSKVFNSFVENSQLRFDSSFNKKASLLVYASVSDWEEIQIPSKVKTYKELEDFIHKKANEQGFSNKAFPFLIDGKAKFIDWHVINWKDGDMDHSHEKHKKSGLYGRLKNTDLDILGFYSSSHHGIFTHHSTNMHMHFKTKDQKLAGHLDDIQLSKSMILKLPK